MYSFRKCFYCLRPTWPMSTHCTILLQTLYSPIVLSSPYQGFRWLIRSLICPLNDITISQHPTHAPYRTVEEREGEKARSGSHWRFREGELAQQWSIGDLVGAHRLTLTHSFRAMAAGTAEGFTHMEELVDQGLGMEETAHGLLRRPSLKESYHCDSLLAPDTDFLTGR